jgi:hypothetical protein
MRHLIRVPDIPKERILENVVARLPVVFLHRHSDPSVHTHAKSYTKRPRGTGIGFDSCSPRCVATSTLDHERGGLWGGFVPCERGMRTNHIGLSFLSAVVGVLVDSLTIVAPRRTGF